MTRMIRDAISLGVLAVLVYATLLRAQEPAVPITPAINTWQDLVRVWVMPAVGAFLMGLVAILLDRIRRALNTTSALTLVAGANASSAAKEAKEGRLLLAEEATKHFAELQVIKDQGAETLKVVNGAAERAARQIEALSEQLRGAGLNPEKGD